MRDPDSTRLHDTMRWALDANTDPAMASADWLATDIDPTATSATDLLSRETVSLESLRAAKSAFKTMRIIGETSQDRRLGARLYAAAICASFVFHNVRITSQSDSALFRAFSGLSGDDTIPAVLRELADRGLKRLNRP